MERTFVYKNRNNRQACYTDLLMNTFPWKWLLKFSRSTKHVGIDSLDGMKIRCNVIITRKSHMISDLRYRHLGFQ